MKRAEGTREPDVEAPPLRPQPFDDALCDESLLEPTFEMTISDRLRSLCRHANALARFRAVCSSRT